MQPYSETLSVSWNLLQQERPEHQLHVRPITGCNFLYETIPPSLPLLTSAAEIVQQAAEREPVGSEHITSIRQVLEPPADQSAAKLEDDLHVLSQTYAAAGETGRTAAAQDVAAVVAGDVSASQGSQRQVQQTLNWLTERYGSDSMNLQQPLRQAEQDRQLRRRSETTSSISSVSLSSGPVSRDQSTSRSVTPQSPQLSPAGHATGQMSAHMASVSIQPDDHILIGSVQQMIADIVAGRRPGTIQILINNWQQQTGQQDSQSPSSNQ